jgi:hypothetical protein
MTWKRHLLVHEPIAGLVDGVTYYTRNVSGDTFQLATTPGGAPITTLDGTDRAGTHSFARAGLDLVGQTARIRCGSISRAHRAHITLLLWTERRVAAHASRRLRATARARRPRKGGGGGFVASGDPTACSS